MSVKLYSDTNVTKHFSKKELTVSSTADHMGIKNTPTDAEWENILYLATQLEKIREYLGAPIRISSAFRSEKVNKLNSIMHPAIIKISKEKIEHLKSMKKKLIIVVIPLLFEVNLEYVVDKILLVAASREKQTERIIKRDNTNKTDAENIINSQMPLDEKRKKSDFIIENNGSLSELREKVLEFLNNLNYTGENI